MILKEKLKNFKERNFKGATGGLNKKLLSVVRLPHQKKQFPKLLRPIEKYIRIIDKKQGKILIT